MPPNQARDAYNAPAGSKSGTVADHRLLNRKESMGPTSTGVKKKHWGDTRSEAEKERDAHNAAAGYKASGHAPVAASFAETQAPQHGATLKT